MLETMTKNIILLGLTIALSLSCSRFQRIRKSDQWEDKFQAAVAYYEDENYAHASILFEDILPLMRGLAEEEKTLFYYAYAQFYQKKYLLSAHYFGVFVDTYGRSLWLDEAIYRQVESLYLSAPEYLYDQSTTYDALDKAQAFLDERPENPYRQQIQRMVDALQARLEKKAFEIAQRYFLMRYYKAATFALDNFRLYFPESPRIEYTKHLRIQAQYEWARRAIAQNAPTYYRKTIRLYEEFIETYPNSQYAPLLVKLYEKSVHALHGLEGSKNLSN